MNPSRFGLVRSALKTDSDIADLTRRSKGRRISQVPSLLFVHFSNDTYYTWQPRSYLKASMVPTDDLTWRAATAANLLEARKLRGGGRGRLGIKKTKSGCITVIHESPIGLCRNKHIKCDEGRPACFQCVSHRRECEGYTELGPTRTKAPLGEQLSLSLGLTTSERTFDYFLSWTAPRLAGTLDRQFWAGHVLQMAQSEPVVLDALLALSNLYEHPQFMKSLLVDGPTHGGANADTEPVRRHPGLSEPPPDEHHVVAIHHFNRSITRLTDQIATGKASPLLALVSCLVFVGIEIIRDHVLGALMLLKKGMPLLRQLSERPEGIEDATFKTIKSLFTRLGVICAVFGHSDLLMLQRVDDADKFETLEDGRAALYAILSHVALFLKDVGETEDFETTVRPMLDAETSDSNPSVIDMISLRSGSAHQWEPANPRVVRPVAAAAVADFPPTAFPSVQPGTMPLLADRVHQLLLRLDQWRSTLDGLPIQEQEVTASLLMQYHLTRLWLRNSLSNLESSYDESDNLYDFLEIVRLARLYIHSKSMERPMFTFEVGAVPCLYFVAIRCRVPTLRREAFDLLRKCPGKESVWGHRSVAEMAARLIAIEEQGPSISPPSFTLMSNLLGIDDSVMPSEDRRIHHVEILVNIPAQRFDVRVFRCSVDASGARVETVADYPM